MLTFGKGDMRSCGKPDKQKWEGFWLSRLYGGTVGEYAHPRSTGPDLRGVSGWVMKARERPDVGEVLPSGVGRRPFV